MKIAVKMPPPFRIVPNEESLNIVHQSLIGLNKLRNHLVHPSDYSTEDIIKLYDPLLAYFRFYKLEDRLPTDVPINVRLNYVVTGYCSGLIGSIVTFDNFAASIAEQNSK